MATKYFSARALAANVRHREGVRRDRVEQCVHAGASIILFVFSAIVTPELLCRDKRDGIINLYLVRPLTGSDYIVSRWAALLTVLTIAAWIPQVGVTAEARRDYSRRGHASAGLRHGLLYRALCYGRATGGCAMSENARSMAPVIKVNNVSRWFGSVVAVSDVTFDIMPGITGLLGPNGAGKTTLLRMITGLADTSIGTLTVFGEPVRDNPPLYRRMGCDVGARNGIRAHERTLSG